MILTLRPLIDLDLGHACQYGYHQPAIRVADGPPHQLDTWDSRPRIAAAAAAVLADGREWTTAELADALGLTPRERESRLWPALFRAAGRGEVEHTPADRVGAPASWRAAA